MWTAPPRPHRVRTPRRVAAATLAVTAATLGAVWSGSPPLLAADPPRVGVFLHDERPDFEEAFAGLREGFGLARIEPILLERHARGDEGAARAALAEMELEGVRLVVALGPESALRARDGFRRGGVVHTSVAEPAALGLVGTSNSCGIAAAPSVDRLVAALGRALPPSPVLVVLVPSGSASATAAAERLQRRLEPVGASVDPAARVTFVTPTAAGPDDRAVEVARALPEGTHALLVAPDCPADDVASLAGALAERGVALVGSRRDHLDAGCALVVRTDPRALGALAAVQARSLLDGADPSDVAHRTPRRTLLEVDLNACARLGYAPPLPLLAAADLVVPRYVRSRR